MVVLSMLLNCKIVSSPETLVWGWVCGAVVASLAYLLIMSFLLYKLKEYRSHFGKLIMPVIYGLLILLLPLCVLLRKLEWKPIEMDANLWLYIPASILVGCLVVYVRLLKVECIGRSQKARLIALCIICAFWSFILFSIVRAEAVWNFRLSDASHMERS